MAQACSETPNRVGVQLVPRAGSMLGATLRLIQRRSLHGGALAISVQRHRAGHNRNTVQHPAWTRMARTSSTAR